MQDTNWPIFCKIWSIFFWENYFFLSLSAKPSSVAQVTHSSHIPHGRKSGMQLLISSCMMSTLLLCLCHLSRLLSPSRLGFLDVAKEKKQNNKKLTFFKSDRFFWTYEHHIVLLLSHILLFIHCTTADITPLNTNTFLYFYLFAVLQIPKSSPLSISRHSSMSNVWVLSLHTHTSARLTSAPCQNLCFPYSLLHYLSAYVSVWEVQNSANTLYPGLSPDVLC